MNADMLDVIYKVLKMYMDYGIGFQRFYKVATTLLEKEVATPRIHRPLRICIVEAEFNCIATSQ